MNSLAHSSPEGGASIPTAQADEGVVVLQTARGPIDVDASIAPIVAALNVAGVETIASCSGHGHRPGSIALRDGRELVIARDFDEGRLIDTLFPVTGSGEVVGGRGTYNDGFSDGQIAQALAPPGSDASWADLPCDEQFALATQIAANIGYTLAPEPDHPDCPHAFPGPRYVKQGVPLWAGLVVLAVVTLCAVAAAYDIAMSLRPPEATTASSVGTKPEGRSAPNQPGETSRG